MGSLDYFISVRHEAGSAADSCLVVCLMGEIEKTSFSVIKLCQNDILAAKPVKVVISFQYVTSIEPVALPLLRQMQGLMREQNIELRVCQISSEIKKILLVDSTVQFDELRESLSEALQSFSVKKAI